MIRALKNEQKEEVEKTRPKSVANTFGSFSDTYGQIPFLRQPSNNRVCSPLKKTLSKLEQQAYSSASGGYTGGAPSKGNYSEIKVAGISS